MKHRFIVFLAGALICSFLFWGFTNSDYFKINKSFELFGAVFREIANNYVLDIDADVMVKNGIEGMLSTLDPYTEYYTEEYSEDLDIMTNGLYTGFGFTIAQIDDETTIVGLNENNSAYKMGVRIGDKLYQIDTAIVLKLTGDKLKNFTRGNVGSKAVVRVIREGRPDTLAFNLTRESINMQNVSYYGITEDNIAYIKIDGFTKNSPGEVRNAFMKMKNEADLKGVVLDFRDNPGGLLASAISITELFVPKGSLIVSTKGKDNNSVFEYKSTAEPLDVNLPLAVLINNGSASASEIVAGAIQDLDRGIIVGRRSYGKGLVQSVFDLPFKSYLKMTTAKYYTPSGRCIQKIKFGELYDKTEIAENTDTTIFYTKNGRPVYELTGILPDTTVLDDSLPDIVQSLFADAMVFRFATEFAAKYDKVSLEILDKKDIFGEFEKYSVAKDYSYFSKSSEFIKQFEKAIAENNYSKKTVDNLSTLKKSIENEDRKDLLKYKKEITKYLKNEIIRRFYSNSQFVKYLLPEDKDFHVAKNLLITNKYQSILHKN